MPNRRPPTACSKSSLQGDSRFAQNFPTEQKCVGCTSTRKRAPHHTESRTYTRKLEGYETVGHDRPQRYALELLGDILCARCIVRRNIYFDDGVTLIIHGCTVPNYTGYRK